MLGYLLSGFLRLLFRVWTFGLIYFLDNRLFLWIKDLTTPRLSYKKINPCREEWSPRDHRMDSNLCLLNTNKYSWNSLFLSSLSSSKKLPYIWLAKNMMPSKQAQQIFPPKSSKLDCASQEYWNLHSVTEVAEMGNKNLRTDAMFKDNYSLIPREIMPSCFDTRKQDMGLLEQCIFKDFYRELLQKEKEKMEELLKPDDTAMVCEKHCSSAASIDSGYQSFPSVESPYTCIEEEGVTLYVSDCRYNKDGKLICMTVGFGIAEDSTASSDSLVFDDELSNDSDSECDSSDELEEDFIVFDADSTCEDADVCSFEGFVFEGTADQISVAMSMNTCCHSALEIRITQTLPDPHLCSCDKKDYGAFQEKENFQDKNNVKTKETRTDDLNNSAGTVPKKKKVQFQVDKPIVHEIIAWDFAYRRARIGHWKNYATDRMQFQRRIDQTAKVIEPILEKKISQMKI